MLIFAIVIAIWFVVDLTKLFCAKHIKFLFTNSVLPHQLSSVNDAKLNIHSRESDLGIPIFIAPNAISYSKNLLQDIALKVQVVVDLEGHGLSVWDYYDLWKSQEGKCAICSFLPNPADKSRFKRTLHIDHDHSCCNDERNVSCGKCIRGLLCRSCNVMLGHYERHEGNLVIEQFENYLKESREK